jgi:NTE family protein
MKRLTLLSALLLCASCKTTPSACPVVEAQHPAEDAALPMELCPAARQYPFTNLVFEGGGVKGLAYGGVLEVLEKQGILPGIKRVAGASAGSMASLLVALNYTPKEIRHELLTLDFKKFEDGGGVPGVFRVIDQYGYYQGDFALEWLRCRVAAKTGNPKATFKDLHEQGFRDLYVVVTNLSRHDSVIYSHESKPDMEVALAVRMSMSIPLFFAAVREGDGEVFVDGGVMMNYPISLFDGDAPNPQTIGFILRDTDAKPVARKIGDFRQYTKNLFKTFLDVQADLLNFDKPAMARTATINDLGIPTTDFELTDEQKLALLQQGASGTCTYLRDWRPESLQGGVSTTP